MNIWKLKKAHTNRLIVNGPLTILRFVWTFFVPDSTKIRSEVFIVKTRLSIINSKLSIEHA